MTEVKTEGYKPASLSMQSPLEVLLPEKRYAAISGTEFALLRDGDISGIKATRDLCFGVAFSGLIGLVGLLVAVDWQACVKAGRLMPFICACVLAVMFVAFLGIAIFYAIQIHKTKGNSAYSVVTKRFEEHFAETDAANPD